MKRLLLVPVMIGVFCVTGCGTVDKAFVRGVEAYSVESGMLEQYDQYVDKDSSLTPESKKIRKDTTAGFRKLILEAKKNAGN